MRLMRSLVLLAALGLLSLLLAPCGAAMNEVLPAQPGEEFQLCTCLGTMADAQLLVAKVQETVDGLQVRIQPREIDGRTIYELWVRHPAMSSLMICRALGRASCSSARSECGRKGNEGQ